MKGALILSVVMLSGCAIPSPMKFKDAAEKLSLARTGRSNDIIDGGSLKPESLEELFKPGKRDKDERNEVQSRLLAKSDINCNKFFEAVDSQRASTNIVLGFWSTATATAAAIVAGRAGQNLAGVSAVTSATQQSISDEMYSGILMPNIVREIRGSRETLRNAISEKYSEDIGVYSYYTAVSDAIYYHNLCSMTVALSSIVNKASIQEAKKTLNHEGMLAAIDADIQKTENAILSSDLGLTDTQKTELRTTLVKQYNRRSQIAKMYSLPSTVSRSTGTDADADVDTDDARPEGAAAAGSELPKK